MNRLPTRAQGWNRRATIGVSDPSLTPNAGLAAVSELVEHLNMTATLDARIGPLKQRDRV